MLLKFLVIFKDKFIWSYSGLYSRCSLENQKNQSAPITSVVSSRIIKDFLSTVENDI